MRFCIVLVIDGVIAGNVHLLGTVKRFFGDVFGHSGIIIRISKLPARITVNSISS